MVNQEQIWDSEYKINEHKWHKESIFLPKLLKNKFVLELGVGNGKTLLSILKQKPKSVIALDFSAQALEICKNKFKDKKISFIKANASTLPFKNEEFDRIVCYFLLNNSLKSERKTIASEIHRVLKKGGKIIFQDLEKGDFRSLQGKKTKDIGTLEKKNKIIHHFFTSTELTQLFGSFKSIKIKHKSYRPIKTDKNLERKLISAIITK